MTGGIAKLIDARLMFLCGVFRAVGVLGVS